MTCSICLQRSRFVKHYSCPEGHVVCDTCLFRVAYHHQAYTYNPFFTCIKCFHQGEPKLPKPDGLIQIAFLSAGQRADITPSCHACVRAGLRNRAAVYCQKVDCCKYYCIQHAHIVPCHDFALLENNCFELLFNAQLVVLFSMTSSAVKNCEDKVDWSFDTTSFVWSYDEAVRAFFAPTSFMERLWQQSDTLFHENLFNDLI